MHFYRLVNSLLFFSSPLHRYDCHINVEIATSIKSVKYIYKYILKGSDRTRVAVAPGPLHSTTQAPNHTSRPANNPRTEAYPPPPNSINTPNPSPPVTLGSAVIAASIVGGVGLVESSLQVIDEISDYVEGRYLSSMEAAHRMLKIKLTHRFPPVMALHVHDKDGEHVTFKDGDDITEVAGRKLPKSTLRAWFKLNQYDPAARGLHYSQIPEHYRWMSGQGKWQRRKNTTGVSDIQRVVGRMYFASPSQGELTVLVSG